MLKLLQLQLWQNKYSADFQGCFEDDRAFLIIILCSILIPLGLYFLKLGLVIEFGQHMSELLLKEERKGQIQCFGPRVYRVSQNWASNYKILIRIKSFTLVICNWFKLEWMNYCL